MIAVGGVDVDITERKRAEEALRTSAEQLKQRERFLRTVVDTMPAHINIRDAEGRYVLTNQRLADHYGIDPEYTLGKLPSEVYSHSSVDELEEQEFQRVVKTGVAAVDTEYEYGEEGAEEFRLKTRQPIHDDDGRLLYVLTVSYNITERKRAEQALKESEEALRENQALFDHAARLTSLGHWSYDEVADECIYG